MRLAAGQMAREVRETERENSVRCAKWLMMCRHAMA